MLGECTTSTPGFCLHTIVKAHGAPSCPVHTHHTVAGGRRQRWPPSKRQQSLEAEGSSLAGWGGGCPCLARECWVSCVFLPLDPRLPSPIVRSPHHPLRRSEICVFTREPQRGRFKDFWDSVLERSWEFSKNCTDAFPMVRSTRPKPKCWPEALYFVYSGALWSVLLICLAENQKKKKAKEYTVPKVAQILWMNVTSLWLSINSTSPFQWPRLEIAKSFSFCLAVLAIQPRSSCMLR